jgi:hypothetical protein
MYAIRAGNANTTPPRPLNVTGRAMSNPTSNNPITQDARATAENRRTSAADR